MPPFKPLKIVFWNAQSINNLAKRVQFSQMLRTESIDVFLLAESFLKPQHEFKLDNFVIYRNDRLDHGHGGVAIGIRNNIQHKSCTPVNTNIIENISIELLIDNVQTRITSAYCPKSSTHFANDIQLISNCNVQQMIFGDFNAKHSS